MYYDFSKDLDRVAKKEMKLRKAPKKQLTSKAWIYNDDGSADCYSASMSEILDAYNESKNSYFDF